MTEFRKVPVDQPSVSWVEWDRCWRRSKHNWDWKFVLPFWSKMFQAQSCSWQNMCHGCGFDKQCLLTVQFRKYSWWHENKQNLSKIYKFLQHRSVTSRRLSSCDLFCNARNICWKRLCFVVAENTVSHNPHECRKQTRTCTWPWSMIAVLSQGKTLSQDCVPGSVFLWCNDMWKQQSPLILFLSLVAGHKVPLNVSLGGTPTKHVCCETK